MTMTLISTVTVGSGGAATIEFASIPQTGTDLVLVTSLRTTYAGADNYAKIKFNDNTTGLNFKSLYGLGASAASNQNASDLYTFISGNTLTTSSFSNNLINICNYAGNANKTIAVDSVVENNGSQAFQQILVGGWANTSAITKITLTPYYSSNFSEFSTASLYKINKGSGGATAS